MKKVLVYGCNGLGKDVVYSLNEKECQVCGILDDYKHLIGETIYWGEKLPVYTSNEVPMLIYDYIIIALRDHAYEMRNRLLELGVAIEKILVWKDTESVEILDVRVGQLRLCLDKIKEKGIQGSCAEVGVYKGDFAKYINLYLPDRKLYLFDTFEGFGKQNLIDVEQFSSLNERFLDTSVDEVLEKMPYRNQIEIKKGYFPSTAKGIEDRFVFVSLDADLYTPIKAGLDYFYNKMVMGGYIFVHDYGTYVYPGVKKAVDEFCEKNRITIILFMDRCLSAIIVKQ